MNVRLEWNKNLINSRHCLQANAWVLLTDDEVANRFVIIEERKRRIIESKLRAQQREEKRLQSEELVARLAEARMQKRMEQQGDE